MTRRERLHGSKGSRRLVGGTCLALRTGSGSRGPFSRSDGNGWGAENAEPPHPRARRFAPGSLIRRRVRLKAARRPGGERAAKWWGRRAHSSPRLHPTAAGRACAQGAGGPPSRGMTSRLKGDGFGSRQGTAPQARSTCRYLIVQGDAVVHLCWPRLRGRIRSCAWQGGKLWSALVPNSANLGRLTQP